MAYIYGTASINFPDVGEYLKFHSVAVDPGGTLVEEQVLVLGTSVSNLAAFPTNQEGTPVNLSSSDFMPIVDVNGNNKFGYKITLGQISTFISEDLGISGINGNLSLGGNLLLDEDKYIKWDYAIGATTYEYGITFNQTDGWKFKGLTSGFTTQALGLTKDGVLKLTGITLEPAIVAGGLYYDNTNLYFGQ